jgi:hypothetical protein
MLVNALHTAFKDREKVFNLVCANTIAPIFARTVFYALVIGKVFTNFAIKPAFIRMQNCKRAYILTQDFRYCFDIGAINMECPAFSLTDQTNHGAFICWAA